MPGMTNKFEDALSTIIVALWPSMHKAMRSFLNAADEKKEFLFFGWIPRMVST